MITKQTENRYLKQTQREHRTSGFIIFDFATNLIIPHQPKVVASCRLLWVCVGAATIQRTIWNVDRAKAARIGHPVVVESFEFVLRPVGVME